jgi:hypothetical protein
LTVIYVINAHNLAENGLFRTCYGKMWEFVALSNETAFSS